MSNEHGGSWQLPPGDAFVREYLIAQGFLSDKVADEGWQASNYQEKFVKKITHKEACSKRKLEGDRLLPTFPLSLSFN